MKPWIWLRIVSVLLAVFCLGHTLGTLDITARNAEEQVVFNAMRGFRFDIMGSARTHWDFYRGMNLYLSVFLLMLVILTWQLAGLSRTAPGPVRKIVLFLLVGHVGIAALSWMYFFAAPAVLSSAATLCLTVAFVALGKQTTEP